MIKKCLIFITLSFILALPVFNVSCDIDFNIKEQILSKFKSEERMDAAVETVDLFFHALIEKDYKKAYTFISVQDRNIKDLGDFEEEMRDVTDIIDIKINWVEVKDNIAIIGVDIMDYYDGSEKLYKDIEVSLIKEEDEWKINFW